MAGTERYLVQHVLTVQDSAINMESKHGHRHGAMVSNALRQLRNPDYHDKPWSIHHAKLGQIEATSRPVESAE